MTLVIAGTAGARGAGRWPAGVPASVWSGATWQEATAAERRSYLLGLTDLRPSLPRELLEFGRSEDPQQEEREETCLK
jgi:hypothetical protein